MRHNCHHYYFSLGWQRNIAIPLGLHNRPQTVLVNFLHSMAVGRIFLYRILDSIVIQSYKKVTAAFLFRIPTIAVIMSTVLSHTLSSGNHLSMSHLCGSREGMTSCLPCKWNCRDGLCCPGTLPRIQDFV